MGAERQVTLRILLCIMNLNDLLDLHAAQLAEHFDAVQILAEVTLDGKTHGYRCGRGSWYARQGLAHTFIQAEIADEIGHQVSKHSQPPLDDYAI